MWCLLDHIWTYACTLHMILGIYNVLPLPELQTWACHLNRRNVCVWTSVFVLQKYKQWSLYWKRVVSYCRVPVFRTQKATELLLNFTEMCKCFKSAKHWLGGEIVQSLPRMIMQGSVPLQSVQWTITFLPSNELCNRIEQCGDCPNFLTPFQPSHVWHIQHGQPLCVELAGKPSSTPIFAEC